MEYSRKNEQTNWFRWICPFDRGLSGAISLLGRIDDVSRILPALDVFVLVSDYEGLSNAIMEAQSFGIPVVVTDVGGNREIAVDGQTGFLVAPGESGPFADRVRSLLADPERRSSMGAEARRWISTEFSPGRMIRATASVYRELLTHSEGALGATR